MKQAQQRAAEYQKVKAVRESIVGGEDKLEGLINNERKLIKEGQMVKVCRSKNKSEMYWLFDDCLIYGAPMTGGKFNFSR